MLFGGALKGPASKVPELAWWKNWSLSTRRKRGSLLLFPNFPSLVGDVYHLVGGLEHELYFPFHRKGIILPIDELIFFKMVKITNQSWFIPLWKGTLEKKLWRYARRIWFLRLPDLILGEELRKPSINWWWWWWWDDDNHNGNGNDLPTYHWCWPLPFMLNHYHWC